MGTRADFYVGRGEQAEWLGSIAFDGNPGAREASLLNAVTEADYRAAVEAEFIESRNHCTRPDQGWPWPWDDSRTTDYAYAFDGGKVHASCFGHAWFDPTAPIPEDEEDADLKGGKVAVFPNMKSVAKPTLGKRSGCIVVGAGGIIED